MSKRVRRTQAIEQKRVRNRRRLALIPVIALAIKILIILRIQGFEWYESSQRDLGSGLASLLDGTKWPAGAWYGADGENYIRGLLGLLKDGFFSTEGTLSYWPAGYPILLWPLILIAQSSFFPVLVFLQSALYALACIVFVDEISRSRLSRFALPTALILSLNPTLALNTIAIGYELPVVSLILIATSLLLRNIRRDKHNVLSWEMFASSLAWMIVTFMQPRFIIIAAFFFLLWSLSKFPLLTGALFLATSMTLVAVAPAVMMWRNQVANGYTAISTNLGSAMLVGAGPLATGGYKSDSSGLPCSQAKETLNAAQRDRAVVKCVVKWSLENPGKSLKLFWNKARFFWSPWFGAEANGTMARNPWRINHPLNETVKTEAGFKLVTGAFGKATSSIWTLLTLVLLIYGFVFLWRAGSLERLLGVFALTATLANWLSSILTIGDHRFRIPTMGLSLFLQVVGFSLVFIRGRTRLSGTSPKVEWPGLYWIRRKRGDILTSGN